MTDESVNVIELDARLDSPAAEKLYKALIDNVDSPITLNASEVNYVGGQALQVLISATAYWNSRDIDFSITNATEDFRSGLSDLGTDEKLLQV